ncbi:FAT4 protein, partial [Polypterus senegalus]
MKELRMFQRTALFTAFLLCSWTTAFAHLIYSVHEESTPGTIIGNIVKDLGLDLRNLEVRGFRLISGSKQELLKVNRKTGMLSVNEIIDRELLCAREDACFVNIKIVIENPLEIHPAQIEILDVNDNSPAFPENTKTLEMSEITPAGSRFPLEGAYDPDTGPNSLKFYQLSGNDFFVLEVKEDSKKNKIPLLVLQKPLDREENAKFNFLLLAVDGGNPPKSGSMNISILVEDVNDNVPIFLEQTYSVTLEENSPLGALVVKVNASDLDEGKNSEIIYSFGSSVDNTVRELFELDSNTGYITVKGVIDFEQKEFYEFDIKATDRGQVPMSSHCTVLIKVKDRNDNAPVIEVTSLTSSILENAKTGTIVGLITITDLDSGINSKIKCTLSDKVPFEMKPSFQENLYSLVTKSQLDRESANQYNVTITAKDLGHPSLSSYETVLINVLDVNDNHPKFLQDPYVFYIEENNTPGASVFAVSAVDVDANENALVTYYLREKEVVEKSLVPFLSINPDNGQVFSFTIFDFEEVKSFAFNVIAKDSGVPSLSSNVTVNVFILDQNDNPPVIVFPLTKNGTAVVEETIPRNVKSGYFVTRIKAYDADVGYNAWLSFSLEEATDRSVFSVGRYTGEIRTHRAIGESDVTVHKLVILVKDGGRISFSASATVIVTVAENMEANIFSEIKSTSSLEKQENKMTVFLIIVLSSVSSLFVITIITLMVCKCHRRNAFLSNNYIFDTNYAEVSGSLFHQYQAAEKQLVFVGPDMNSKSVLDVGSNRNTLVISDGGIKIAQAVIFLWCCWKHALSHLRYSIQEESTSGTIIGNIIKDLGLDIKNLEGRGFRVISGSKQQLLQVNRKTGALFINEIIDREVLCEKDKDCFISIKIVIENPLEIHEAEIEIVDINDNSPAFPEKAISLEILESSPLGSRFPLEGAYDPDCGVNSLKLYELSQNDRFILQIKEGSKKSKVPVLVLQKALDRELKEKYDILLTAFDGGNPPRSGNMNISILVGDSNDNAPVFLEETYSVTLEENASVGTLVLKVNASDLDEGTNGEIVYSFQQSVQNKVGELFQLDMYTGEITVKGVIDFEEKEFYDFDVKATDRGQIPLSSHCTVLIKILDMNDNAPLIEITSLTSSISEDVKRGTVVGLISITDLDSGVNSKMRCTSSENLPFELKKSLQKNLYSLLTTSLLDRESTSYYNITITAKDFGQPSLTTYETVTVNVLDVNDNHPRFLQDPYVFYLEENNTPGASICAISAVDEDANENAVISYYLRENEAVDKPLLPFLSINSLNGQVFSFVTFDFEEVKSFTFIVVAKDSGGPSLSSNVTVKVFILDQNDNSPVVVFPLTANQSAIGEETIPRNVKAGHLITRIRAYDADVGYNAWLSFSLDEVSDRSLFSVGRYTGDLRTLRAITESDMTVHKMVNLKTGDLYVNEMIDREVLCDRDQRCFISIKMFMENPMEIHQAEIEILDINDNSPAFENKKKRLEISELTQTGARFPLEGAADSDSGINSLKFYQLSQNDHFVLEVKDIQKNKIPVLVLQKALDREVKGNFDFLLTAFDGGNPPKSGDMNITVIVSDVNDNAPVFAEEIYHVTLEENVPLGTFILKVNAIDLDEGINGAIVYSFEDSTKNKISGLFQLDSYTGEIIANGLIDFEERKFYEIEVKATDKGHVPMSSHCTVLIKIKDINDNAPLIEVASLTSSIFEDVKPGTVVGLISISDLDSGVNSKITCSLPDKLPFQLKPALQENLYSLITSSRLDRESVSQYNITITSRDFGLPSLSSHETILINVLDVNDNNPKFLKDPYIFFILENSTPGVSICAVSAVDADAKENALISYYLKETEVVEKPVVPFLSINSENGQVFSFTTFDFEEMKSFTFTVIAKDSGVPSLSSSVTVRVFILDQNDNPPVIVFPFTTNGTSVVEETIPRNVKAGYFVTRIRAYDADVGYNAWLTFSLDDATDSSLFSVGRYTGEIRTIRAISESDVAVLKIVVLVKDSGSVSLSASATVIVTTAENMEANAFSEIKSSRTREEKENNVTFYLIIILSSVSSLFLISIIILIAFRCQKTNQDFLTKYYLDDTNYAEVSGSLFHSHHYQTAENRLILVGPEVNRDSVMDVGSNGNTLIIPDNGIKIAQMRIFFLSGFLMCIWKNAFAKLRYSLQEESIPGTMICNIIKDMGLDLKDVEDRGFRLISGSKQQLLQVNHKTGALFVNEIIDREVQCDKEKPCFLDIKIVVENPLEIHQAEIEILDINDNSPVFLEKTKIVEISESTPVGSRFTLEGAYDPDYGVNSLKSYELSDNINFLLQVKEGSNKDKIPVLVLQKAFDREVKAKYEYTLTAIDGGKPPRSGKMNITVMIADVNDNVPIFDREIYSVILEENCSIGSLVLKMNASDLDEGSNGEIIYSFDSSVKNKVEDVFELDVYSGEITVKGLIDFEKKTFYEFQVKATDRAPVPMSSECTVLIKIKDVNDNAPSVEVTSLTSSISEDVKPGTTIGLISITDLDSGVNSKISCTLSRNLPFELTTTFQENLYSLKTISKLDRESVSQYNITIIAKDFGNPSLSSQKNVFVTLMDVNDNQPKFLQDPYVFYIEENNIPGASILAVSAVDADANENAVVTYHLREKETVYKPMVPFLSIMSDSGQVFSFTTFDAEELNSFTFTVVAKDTGVPSLSCNVTVTVFILDQNDNTPIFVFPVATNGTSIVEETIPRNVKAGYLVTRIRAYDADVGYNAWLSFYLEEATDLSLFSVGRYTGEIRTRRAMAESDGTLHKMIILVKDSGSISLSASATVIITAAENTEAHALSEIKSNAEEEEGSTITFYLIIVLSSVSSLFIITILTLIAIQCHRARGHFLRSKYLENVNYAEVSGSLFHSHNYQAAEKRFVFVGSEGSRNSVMEVGSNGNTLVISDGGINIAPMGFVKIVIIIDKFEIVLPEQVWHLNKITTYDTK